MSVTRLPRPCDEVPMAAFQGTLALDLDRPAPPRPTDRASVERLIQRMCPVLVEVICGDRNVQQLLRSTSTDLYERLMRRQIALSNTVGRDQRVRRLRATVRSIKVSWPHDHAAEVSVHLRHGQRSRALAARFERRDERWICSALELG